MQDNYPTRKLHTSDKTISILREEICRPGVPFIYRGAGAINISTFGMPFTFRPEGACEKLEMRGAIDILPRWGNGNGEAVELVQ